MLAVISPAKSLDFDQTVPSLAMSQTRMTKHSSMLAKRAAKLSVTGIKQLMELSDDLASLNYERFQTLSVEPDAANRKQAILAFNGDVYLGLEAKTLDEAGLQLAQEKIRILSGLYGLLRPLDGIRPYRLEMGRALSTSRGKTLYAFWGSHITELMNQDLEETGSKVLVNLASQEYFKSIKPKELSVPIVVPDFKESRDGRLKSISFSAKKARGLMARFIVDNDIKDPEALKDFDLEGYKYEPSVSDDKKWLFVRPDQRLA